MSQQSAKQFIERCQKDPNFKKQLAQAMSKKSKEDVAEFIKKNGYTFTEKEYKEAGKVALGKDLSEKELTEIVAGTQGIVLRATE